jgi:hypothetical protein
MFTLYAHVFYFIVHIEYIFLKRSCVLPILYSQFAHAFAQSTLLIQPPIA